MSANAVIAARTYDAKVHRFIAHRVHNPADVDDLAQEVYLQLVRQQGAIDNPGAYLFGIVANVVSDFRKDRYRYCGFITTDSELVGEAAVRCASGEDLEARLHVQQQVERTLALLPPMQAAVLRAHEGDGLSYLETAKELGLRPLTVKKYLMLAKSTLRAMRIEMKAQGLK